MAITKSDEMFYSILDALKDGQKKKGSEIRDLLRGSFGLDAAELETTSATGKLLVDVRMNWAMSYLGQAEAIIRPEKGYLQITPLGLTWLKESNGHIDPNIIFESEGYQRWRDRSREMAEARKYEDDKGLDLSLGSEQDPLTLMNSAEQALRSDVGSQILERIKSKPPVFLEKLILKLLHAMGYAADEKDLEHTGSSGDGGIDGIVHQDLLGLDKVYIQAKRFEHGKVGPGDINSFIGALNTKKASRGVFITTSQFTEGAKQAAQNAHNITVALIDGETLVEHMLKFQIGVFPVKELKVYALDENFYDSEGE